MKRYKAYQQYISYFKIKQLAATVNGYDIRFFIISASVGFYGCLGLFHSTKVKVRKHLAYAWKLINSFSQMDVKKFSINQDNNNDDFDDDN